MNLNILIEVKEENDINLNFENDLDFKKDPTREKEEFQLF